MLSREADSSSVEMMRTKTIQKAEAPGNEKQVEAFLKRLPSLRSKKTPAAKASWRGIIGTSKGDALDEEAAKLGAEWRARMNERKSG